MINLFNLKMDLKRTAPHDPLNAIERGGSGDAYPAYSMRLGAILDPSQGISIGQSGPPMMLDFGLKK